MTTTSEFIHGPCQQMLFSPKGAIEGVLVKMKSHLVQVSVPHAVGEVLTQLTGPGKPLHLLAHRDSSPKSAGGAHPVYEFLSFADVAGEPIKTPHTEPSETTIEGVVQTWHFARHGEANGVMLESGEFIHLKPKGMAAAGLDIGSKVLAIGRVGMTALGTRMLEARRVNNLDLA
jgi:hypothetical protein